MNSIAIVWIYFLFFFSFTHVLHGGVAGDLLKLAADHLRARAVVVAIVVARLFACMPDTDYARYNKSHQSDDADQ